MKNKIFISPFFDSGLKRLDKEFPSLGNEIDSLEKKLLATPKLGERHQTLRNWP